MGQLWRTAAKGRPLPLINAAGHAPEKLLGALRAQKAPCAIVGLSWAEGLACTYPTAEAFLSSAWGSAVLPQRETRRVELSGGAFTTPRTIAVSALAGSQGQLSFSTAAEEDLQAHCDSDWGSEFLSPPTAFSECSASPVVSIGGPSAGLEFHRHEESWLALVCGSKQWRVADPTCQLGELQAGTAPVWSYAQEPGTTVYVPPGYWHATRCALHYRSPRYLATTHISLPSWCALVFSCAQ